MVYGEKWGFGETQKRLKSPKCKAAWPLLSLGGLVVVIREGCGNLRESKSRIWDIE